MNLIHKENFKKFKDNVLKDMRTGKVFIYPSDIGYAIGCNAKYKDSVRLLRELIDLPESDGLVVAAPSDKWVAENISLKDDKSTRSLGGPNCIITRPSKSDAVADVVLSSEGKLSICVMKDWFAEVIEDVDIPFVRMPVSNASSAPMTKLDDMPRKLLERVDYVIYQGVMKYSPGDFVDLDSN